jgi:HEAT repeat protein
MTTGRRLAVSGLVLSAAGMLSGCAEERRLQEHRDRRAREEERADLVRQLADPATGADAAREIRARGTGMVPDLLRAAQSGDPALQVPAIGLLSHLGPPEARLPLQELAVTGPAPEVRAAASSALAEYGDATAAPALAAALAGEPSADVRVAFVRALGALWDPRGYDALKAAFHDASDPVRFAAYDALGDWGGDIVAEAMVRRLEELPPGGLDGPDLPGDYAEHQVLLMAMGRTLSPVALEPLSRQLLESPAARVRRTAAEALRHLENPRAIRPLIRALLDADEGVYAAALDALEALTGRRYEITAPTPEERRRRTFDRWVDWAADEAALPGAE